MKTTFIYGLLDPRDNFKIYIGKSDKPETRYKQHLNRLKQKTKKTDWLNKLLTNGLKPELIILDEVSIDEWNNFEIYWINQFTTWGFELMNLTTGGEGGDTFSKQSIEKQIELRLIASSTMKKTMLNKPKSDGHKKKISEFQKSQKRSESSNIKRSLTLKGRTSPNKGNILSKESRDRLGNAHKKNLIALDLKLNIVTTGLGYQDLADKLKANKNYVSDCRRMNKLFRGIYWIILEEDLEVFTAPKPI